MLRPLPRRAPALIQLPACRSALLPRSLQQQAHLSHWLKCCRYAQLLMSGTKPVTCAFYDAPGRMLWLGHADGLVSAYAIGRTTGPSCDAEHVVHWQAHRMGAVTAIVRTAAGGLWTGTSRGSLRIWSPEARQAASGGPAVSSASDIAASARELRRPHGAKPHNSGVAFLVASATGQVGQSPVSGQTSRDKTLRASLLLVKPFELSAGHCGPAEILPGIGWPADFQHQTRQILLAGGVVMQHPVAAALVCAQRRFLRGAAARARYRCPLQRPGNAAFSRCASCRCGARRAQALC